MEWETERGEREKIGNIYINDTLSLLCTPDMTTSYPAFQCFMLKTLKSWVGPGDEARLLVQCIKPTYQIRVDSLAAGRDGYQGNCEHFINLRLIVRRDEDLQQCGVAP